MTPLEAVREHFVRTLAAGRLEYSFHALWMGLSARDARTWVEEAVALLDKLSGRGQFDVAYCLSWFQAQRPGIMEGLYEKLVGARCFWAPHLFRGADAATRDAMLQLIGEDDLDDTTRNALIACLAWIGDGAVITQLLKWRRRQPTWRDQLNIDTHDFAPEAGWELTHDGKRRELFLPDGYELVANSTGRPARPLDAITPADSACRWCQAPLVNVLDVDLKDDRTAFLHLRGTRLRIGLCINCVPWTTFFTRVDRRGGFTWHPANKKPSRIPPEDERSSPTFHQFRLGKRLKSPIEKHIRHDWDTSQIGGLPAWVNDAAFPDCPDCGRLMPALAQVKTEEYEGPYYVYFCGDCNVAAVNYDQT